MKKSLIYILVACMLLCLVFVFSCNKDNGDTNTNTNTNTDTSTDTSTNDPDFVEPDGLKLTLNKETAFTVTALDYKNEPISKQKQECSKHGSGLCCSNYYLIGGSFDD